MQFLHNLSVVTRAKDWRLSFVPFIMGCVYMWLWWFQLPCTAHTILLTFLSLITTIGFASLGYFINEFFDKASDAKAGKLNKLTFIAPTLQFAIFASSVALTFLPWIWLPASKFSWLLIGVQISLFLIYSLPFPRLKESTYLSVIIDALYAYVVPLALSFYTFSLIANTLYFPAWFYLFAVAVFFIGLRNIIIHQADDIMKDKQSGMKTLPMILGIANTKILLQTVLLYEVLFSTLWMLLLGVERFIFLPCLIVYLLLAVYSANDVNTRVHNKNSQFIINNAYQYLIPLVMILLLTINDVKWLAILPLHVMLLVPFHLLQKTLNIINSFISVIHRFVLNDVRNFVSAAINYPIYYCLLMFGVDLKKEQMSAWEFLQSRIKKGQ